MDSTRTHIILYQLLYLCLALSSYLFDKLLEKTPRTSQCWAHLEPDLSQWHSGYSDIQWHFYAFLLKAAAAVVLPSSERELWWLAGTLCQGEWSRLVARIGKAAVSSTTQRGRLLRLVRLVGQWWQQIWSNCGLHANASQECERLWSDQDNLEKDIGTLSREPLEYDWWFCSIETSIWCWFPTSTTPWIFFIREVVRFVSRNPGIPCSKPENLTRTPQTYARATKSSSLLGVINPTFQNNAVVEQQLFWHHFFIVLYCYIMLYMYIAIIGYLYTWYMIYHYIYVYIIITQAFKWQV